MTNIELRELLVDKIDTNQKHLLQLLEGIHEQTTRTNGRVTTLENRVSRYEVTESKHYQNCPNGAKIDKLSEEMSLYRMAVKYPKIVFVGLVVSFGLVFASVGYGVYEVHKVIKEIKTESVK